VATVQGGNSAVKRAAANPQLELLERLGYVARGALYVVMGLLSWIVLGLIAGVIADFLMHGGFGLIGSIIIGIVGAVVGSALAEGSGAGVVTGSGVAVGSGVATGVGSGVATGVGSGVGAGSVDAAGLSVGAGDGSAAIVPTGATIVNSSRATCRPIRILRTRRNRDAAEDANIDVTPLPGLADPSSKLGARSVMAIAIR